MDVFLSASLHFVNKRSSLVVNVRVRRATPQISDKINDAIVKGMALQPEDRPQTIKDWLELLGIASADEANSPAKEDKQQGRNNTDAIEKLSKEEPKEQNKPEDKVSIDLVSEKLSPQTVQVKQSLEKSASVAREVNSEKTPPEKPIVAKKLKLSPQLVIPSVLVVVAGSVGLWAMQMRTGSNTSVEQPPKTQTAKPPLSTPIQPSNVTEPELWALLTTKEDITFERKSPNGKVTKLIVPEGSVLQITTLEVFGNMIDRDYDLNVRLCPSPNSESTPPVNPNADRRLLLPKEEVSIQYSKIFPAIASIQPSQENHCSKNGG